MWNCWRYYGCCQFCRCVAFVSCYLWWVCSSLFVFFSFILSGKAWTIYFCILYEGVITILFAQRNRNLFPVARTGPIHLTTLFYLLEMIPITSCTFQVIIYISLIVIYCQWKQRTSEIRLPFCDNNWQFVWKWHNVCHLLA